MLNKYDVMERLIIIGGYAGRVMVWIGMACACILFWYLIITKMI